MGSRRRPRGLQVWTACAAVALVTTIAGCGSDGGAEPQPDAAATADRAQTPEASVAEPSTATAPVTGPSTEPTPGAPPAPASSAPATTSGASSERPDVLHAAVGEPGDPDAFVITLTDESGEPVTRLPAGGYEVRVDDPSDIHNVHIAGPGVDESTPVDGTADPVWDVTLRPGDYIVRCDPHISMLIDLTVT